MTYRYDSEFFNFVAASSGKSAHGFVRALTAAALDGVVPRSILDVGCGCGIWLAEWRRLGEIDVIGVDGDYVDPKSLTIPLDNFLARNIALPFDLGRRFELVECLEVAEHLAAEHANALVDNLVRHGDLIVFSSAIPGQGGEFHVNEQPYEYWRDRFAERGYQLFDAIRSHIRSQSRIEPWYRYNSFIYANPQGATRLAESTRRTAINSARPIPDIAPLWWRARCRMISLLPGGVASEVARIKHRAANLMRQAER